MGFKRTSEGRVFFKGADNDDAPKKETEAPSAAALSSSETKASVPVKADPVMSGDQTQMQILLMLKSLNVKLQESREDRKQLQKQLDKYKKAINQLEGRASKHEEDYIDLEQKVARKQTETIKKASRVEDTIKQTVKDFEDTRKILESLESKTEESDKALEALKSETEKREKLEAQLKESAKALALLKKELQSRKDKEDKDKEEQKKAAQELEKRQKELEKKQEEQNEKMVDSVAAYVALTKRVNETETRQVSLDNKIEEASAEFIKLDRKIDKVIDDRVRVLRKIERVEEAVMQTRDALNAKAMVLLTNQGIAGIDVPQITDKIADIDPMALQRRMQEEAVMPWWRRPVRLHAAALALLLLIGVLSGWLLSGLQNGNLNTKTKAEESPRIALHMQKSASGNNTGAQVSSSAWSQDAAAGNAGRTAADLEKDINEVARKGTLDINDEEELLATMESNPQAVAERLNEIEPSSLTQKDQIAETTVEAPRPPPQAAEEAIQVASLAQTPVSSIKSDLKQKIKPDPNLPEIAKKIEAQAFEGVPEAQHDMGAIYVAGHGQVSQDLGRAVTWFEAAADNGVANAKYNLGVLYHQGMGVPKDVNKAISLYTEAAEQGHPEAQYNLGIANIEGIGVPYNPEKAAWYFENAANADVVEAAYNLGLIYENGLLGSPRPDEALMWYKLASDKGSPEAKAALEQLASSIGVGLEDVNRIVESVKASRGLNGTATQSAAESETLVAQIQQELARLGLYPGPVDGKNGPKTADAIRSFQRLAKLTPDGLPSAPLLAALKAGIHYDGGE